MSDVFPNLRVKASNIHGEAFSNVFQATVDEAPAVDLNAGIQHHWYHNALINEADAVGAVVATRIGGGGGPQLAGNAVHTEALGNLDPANTGNTRLVAAGLYFGDTDWTFSVLYKPVALTNFHFVLAKRVTTGTDREWFADIKNTGEGRFSISPDGLQESLSVQTAETVNINQWNRLTWWHDSVNDLIGVQLNSGAPVTLATGGLFPHNGGQDMQWFTNGASSGGRPQEQATDETSIWSRVLSAAERAELITQDGLVNTYPW